MKEAFYYSVTVLKRNKRMGYNTNEVKVYSIRNTERREAVLECTTTYQTGSNPGGAVLAYKELIKHNRIPQEYENINYYEQKDYIMHELY